MPSYSGGQFIWGSYETYTENVSPRAHSLKSTNTLNSGTEVHEVYTDNTLSDTSLILSTNSFFNLNGTIIMNELNDSLSYHVGPDVTYLPPYDQAYTYVGSALNEHVSILDSYAAEDNSFATLLYHGGSGKDTIFYPDSGVPYTIRANPLGFYLIETEFEPTLINYGKHTNYHIINGFESLELVGKTYSLRDNPLGIDPSDYTFGRFGWTPEPVGPGKNNDQVLNDQNNIYVCAGYGGEADAHFSEELVDFGDGIDILIYPKTSASVNFQFINENWYLVHPSYTDSYVDLEFVLFTDKAFELGADGVVTEHNWVDIDTPLTYLNRAPESAPEPVYNRIIGTKKADVLNGTKKDDFIDGKKGNDELYGSKGNDLLIGGKGADWLYGGKGFDIFVTSKKYGKGKKNEDQIYDFEDGIDRIEIYGSTKGLKIVDLGEDAFIMKKNDVIAWVGGAAGQLSWTDVPGMIM